MFHSVNEVFSIGVGPSSSHTVGPMKAGFSFASDVENKYKGKTKKIQVKLYGSLAATGKGHSTDKAILMGLEGEEPDKVIAFKIDTRVEEIYASNQINFLKKKKLPFVKEEGILFFPKKQKKFHSNAMVFSAYGEKGELILEKTYYSIGGGAIVEDSELDKNGNITIEEIKPVPFSFYSAKDLIEHAKKNQCSIADIMLENEKVFRSETEVMAIIKNIWKAMQSCTLAGITTKGILPGGLEVKRRAFDLHQKIKNKKLDHNSAMQWLSLYALAVNEENAAGSNVVTAPTNGAAGIVPAVFHYFQKFYQDPDDQDLKDYFLTSAAICNLYKNKASISGAEMGCQGEVGVACSMAAGGLAALQKGTLIQIENAAEIGMEHNLGLTCDPVMGLVQVPCIERNTMGAIKAVNAAFLAINQTESGIVSLDKVITTMKETGENMKREYKETSEGGLAINVVEC